MMMSLYNGVAGVKTAGFGTDVVANNIANVNTVGFRGSTAEFKTIFAQQLNQASQNPVTSQIGVGSTGATTAINHWKNGSLQPTDGEFDMAIMGSGFFGVLAQNGQQLFTRDGSFYRDAAGDLVNGSGVYLLGTAATLTPINLSQNAADKLGEAASRLPAYTLPTGVNTTIAPGSMATQSKINLPDILYLPAEPTANVKFQANLDSSVKEDLVKIDLNTENFTATSQNGTLNITGSLADTPLVQKPNNPDQRVEITITDANGAKITTIATTDNEGKFSLTGVDMGALDPAAGDLKIEATTTIKQEVANEHHFTTDVWAADGTKSILKLDLFKVVPQAPDSTAWNITATLTDSKGNEIQKSDGQLLFNDKGALTQNTLPNIGGIAINLGTPADPAVAGSGYDGLKNLPDGKLDLAINKDGAPEGLLKGYSLSDDGQILAVFDNGKQASMGKVAIYHFQNEQGLSKVGETLFSASANSGEPIFYLNAAGEVIYGSKFGAHMLEMSNVDLGVQLTDLITLQKAFESSSKSITTGDEMLKTAINLKR